MCIRSADFNCNPNVKWDINRMKAICLLLFNETYNKLTDIGTYLHRTCTLFNSYYRIFRIDTSTLSYCLLGLTGMYCYVQ